MTKDMSGLNVLLINPKASSHWDRRIPFGLAYLAAVIRKSYRVKIIDIAAEGMSEEQVIDCINKENFQVVGITGMTHQILNAYKMTKLIKQNTKSIVVLGGCHVTFCFEEALKEGVDFVVIGEGEETIIELLEAIRLNDADYSRIKGLAYKDGKDNALVTPKRELLDINKLPLPARDLLPMKKYTDAKIFGRPALEFMFGRGCPHNCIFCSSPQMWERTVRVFDLEKIMEEIKYITHKYRNRYILITDDVFTVRRKLVFDFCQRIKDMNIKWACISRVDLVDREMLQEMKTSGCIRISYGVESGNQRILDFERKGITIERIKEVFRLHREIGLPAMSLMIVGHPLETKQTIQESMDLVKELCPFGEPWAQIMTPLVGTELFNSIANNTGRITSYNWDDYVAWKYPPVFIPKDLDAETIYKAALDFSKIKGMTFAEYVMAYRLIGFDIFNWVFLFRPLIVGTLKKLLPHFVVKWINRLKNKFQVEI